MKSKKFLEYTKTGLGITKSGRLQVPYVCSVKEKGKGLNSYGQPLPKIGDKIAMVSHTGRMTKNNVGIIVDIRTFKVVTELPSGGDYVVLENIAKETPFEGNWLEANYILSDEEYQDAIEYLL